jgi:hypothetical protein
MVVLIKAASPLFKIHLTGSRLLFRLSPRAAAAVRSLQGTAGGGRGKGGRVLSC